MSINESTTESKNSTEANTSTEAKTSLSRGQQLKNLYLKYFSESLLNKKFSHITGEENIKLAREMIYTIYGNEFYIKESEPGFDNVIWVCAGDRFTASVELSPLFLNSISFSKAAEELFGLTMSFTECWSSSSEISNQARACDEVNTGRDTWNYKSNLFDYNKNLPRPKCVIHYPDHRSIAASSVCMKDKDVINIIVQERFDHKSGLWNPLKQKPKNNGINIGGFNIGSVSSTGKSYGIVTNYY